jgi:pyruvate/2-oxoglutarate dehydrogenase complex dihydrolipoamide acyltransferase (E2) component
LFDHSSQAPDGSKGVQVGKLIALLAEDGDDISNLEVPKESETKSPPKEQNTASSDKASSPTPPTSPSSASVPRHEAPKLDKTKPMFPSVIRLLHENDLDSSKIKGTGRHGMLTKGDVLAFLGQASGPTGTYKVANESPIPKRATAEAKVVGFPFGPPLKYSFDFQPQPLSGPELRRLIVEGLSGLSQKDRTIPPRK